MDKELCAFLQDNYPDLNNDIHIRYELGDPFENGSVKRIEQVSFRAATLFENIFSMDDSIYMLIKDWEGKDIMFGSTTPLYLYSLFNSNKMDTETIVEEDENEYREKFFHSHKQHSVSAHERKSIQAGLSCGCYRNGAGGFIFPGESSE